LPDGEIRLDPDSRIGYPSICKKELRNKSRPGKSADLEGRRKWKWLGTCENCENCKTSINVDAAKPRRKMVTREHLEKRCGKRNLESRF